MAEPTPVIAVPAPLLERMTAAMEGAVVEARAARSDIAGLRAALDAHATAEAPVFAAHADYLRRLSDEDSQAAAAGVAASKNALAAAQEKQAATNRLIATIIGGLITLITGILGGHYMFGGPGGTP
jgi:hypothetical protein